MKILIHRIIGRVRRTTWELYYSDGGHGGPYHTLGSAIEAARQYIGGLAHARAVTVEVRPKSGEVAGYRPGNASSFYVTSYDTPCDLHRHEGCSLLPVKPPKYEI